MLMRRRRRDTVKRNNIAYRFHVNPGRMTTSHSQDPALCPPWTSRRQGPSATFHVDPKQLLPTQTLIQMPVSRQESEIVWRVH